MDEDAAPSYPDDYYCVKIEAPLGKVDPDYMFDTIGELVYEFMEGLAPGDWFFSGGPAS